jgi:hypothetical protein
MNLTFLLGPLIKAYDEIRGQPRLKIAAERDVRFDVRKAPASRRLVWAGNRNELYYLLEIQNVSTKPFHFMRATVTSPTTKYEHVLTKGNDGMELAAKEPIHFLLEMEKCGDFSDALITVESLGWKKTYPLKFSTRRV